MIRLVHRPLEIRWTLCRNPTDRFDITHGDCRKDVVSRAMGEVAGDKPYKKGAFPQTELQAERILTLPVNQYMSTADAETVAHAVLQYLSA